MLDYPQYPHGLEWDRTFGDDVYKALCAAIDAPAVEMPSVDTNAPSRTPASRYVGVTRHVAAANDPPKWRAVKRHNGGRLIGPQRPFTDQGEYDAACDYAAWCGWTEPQLRKGRDA